MHNANTSVPLAIHVEANDFGVGGALEQIVNGNLPEALSFSLPDAVLT